MDSDHTDQITRSWPERAWFTLPYLAGVLCLAFFREGTRIGMILAALYAISCIGLTARQGWAAGLAGIISGLVGIVHLTSLFAAVFGYFRLDSGDETTPVMLKSGIILSLCVVLLVFIFIAVSGKQAGNKEKG